jgi:hypothetical protein
MMRRVKVRDSMLGVMASSSVIAISTKISSLVESATKECCALLTAVNDKALVLEDRQVRCFRKRCISNVLKKRLLSNCSG